MKAYKAFFATTALCSGLTLAALATPVIAAPAAGQPAQSSQPGQPGAAPPTAQTQAQAAGEATCPPGAVPGTPACPPATASSNELVVTGSRIKTTTYTSSAPLQVLTAEQAELTGQFDTSQILQLSTVAANSVQVNNFFTGFVVTGGPGVNTLSLRGLGVQRTLFLLNGQRLGPAGVGGTVGPFDLNVLPSSIIDHVEILKDGASSVYGSDAVAGVVNVITKTTQDGFNLHFVGNPTQHGGGNQYQADISWGKTFDRGYVSTSFTYYRQDPLLIKDRSFFSCPTDQVVFPGTGASADIIDPATGKPKCYDFNPTITVVDLGLPGFQEYLPNAGAHAGGQFGTANPGIDVNGFQAVGLQLCDVPGRSSPINCIFVPRSQRVIDVAATRLSAALQPTTSPEIQKDTVISPVSRYTFTLMGQYDLTPHAQLYGSVLLNQRDSKQIQSSQFFVVVLNPDNPFNTALGFSPVTGCVGFCFGAPVLFVPSYSAQTVNYARGVIGVKGDIPNFATFENWTYDVYGQYSHNRADHNDTIALTDRVNATAGAGAGTNGCDTHTTVDAIFGGTPGPGNETMARLEPGVACVPVNYIAAVINGHFTPQETAFLYTQEHGKTTYDQMYVEGSATGDIFHLPAGALSAAVGFQLRRESINDVPGPDFQDANAYHITTAGITKGSQNVEEVYGEFKVPIARDMPFIYNLNVDVSGRYSNYSQVGGTGTYKATIDWGVTDWFTIRGTYGTGFRAPALFELFLADQTSFADQITIDPCVSYLTRGGLPAIVVANCGKNTGIPANLGGAAVSPLYNGSGTSATILTGGGAGHLHPETSIADTLGFVLSPHWGDTSLNIAVDWYNFNIVNQIQQFGAANIVNACYTSTDFPNNPFCSLINRNPPTGTDFSTISLVHDDFVNVAKQVDQGLDVDVQFRTQLPYDIRATIESSLAWTFWENTHLLGGSQSNFLGAIGNPKWVGNVDLRLDRGDWTFNYFIFMVDSGNDLPFIGNPTITNYNLTGQSVIGHYQAPFYTVSNMSVRRKFDKFTVEFGVKNLFDQQPPQISVADPIQARIGNVPLASQYDWYGRSFYFDVNARF